MEHHIHELKLFIDNDSLVLILGSFPSVKSREYGFYYSHPQNRFFKVLSNIFDEDTPLSIEGRKTFLRRHHIALYDVIEECDIIGSSDSSIKNVIPIDISKILRDYPNIKTIGITGNKAKQLFDKYLLDKVGSVGVVYLPSSSPANAKLSVDDLAEEYQKILIFD